MQPVKPRLIPVLLLILSTTAFLAPFLFVHATTTISVIGGASCQFFNTGGCTATMSATTQSGDFMIGLAIWKTSTTSFSTLNDNNFCTSSYNNFFVSAIDTTGSNEIELSWCQLVSASSTAVSFGVTASGPGKKPSGVLLIEAYRGTLQSLGNTCSTTGSGLSATCTATTDKINEWIVGGIVAAAVVTLSMSSPDTQRRSQSNANGPMTGNLGDQTTTSIGSYTQTTGISSSTSWAGIWVGLRAGKGSTTTTVSCTPNPVNVNSPTTCTATVTDTSANPVVFNPIDDSVSWSTNGAGSFSSGTCSLTQANPGTCSVTYTAGGSPGTDTITGSFGGDTFYHLSSSGQTPLVVQAAVQGWTEII